MRCFLIWKIRIYSKTNYMEKQENNYIIFKKQENVLKLKNAKKIIKSFYFKNLENLIKFKNKKIRKNSKNSKNVKKYLKNETLSEKVMSI